DCERGRPGVRTGLESHATSSGGRISRTCRYPSAPRRIAAIAGRRPLAPIRSHHRAELPALAAPHTRAERERRKVVGPRIDVDLGVVDAVLAGHEQPADAVPAHVAERHRAAWCVILGHALTKNRQGTKSSDGDRFPKGNLFSSVGFMT